jgi:hypothetical protein
MQFHYGAEFYVPVQNIPRWQKSCFPFFAISLRRVDFFQQQFEFGVLKFLRASPPLGAIVSNIVAPTLASNYYGLAAQ